MDQIQFRRIGTKLKLVRTYSITHSVDLPADFVEKDYSQEELRTLFNEQYADQRSAAGPEGHQATTYELVPIAVVGEQVNHIPIEACIKKDPDN